MPVDPDEDRILIRKRGSPGLFPPDVIGAAIQLRYHSLPETWFTLERSLGLDFWKNFDEDQPLLGDGWPFDWFFDPLQPAEFFRVVTD